MLNHNTPLNYKKLSSASYFRELIKINKANQIIKKINNKKALTIKL